FSHSLSSFSSFSVLWRFAARASDREMRELSSERVRSNFGAVFPGTAFLCFFWFLLIPKCFVPSFRCSVPFPSQLSLLLRPVNCKIFFLLFNFKKGLES